MCMDSQLSWSELQLQQRGLNPSSLSTESSDGQMGLKLTVTACMVESRTQSVCCCIQVEAQLMFWLSWWFGVSSIPLSKGHCCSANEVYMIYSPIFVLTCGLAVVYSRISSLPFHLNRCQNAEQECWKEWNRKYFIQLHGRPLGISKNRGWGPKCEQSRTATICHSTFGHLCIVFPDDFI